MNKSGRAALAGGYVQLMEDLYKEVGVSTFSISDTTVNRMTLKKLCNNGFLYRVHKGGYGDKNQYKIQEWVIKIIEGGKKA